MVEECFNCGISRERLRLFDAISGKGIVKICKECASKGDMPLVKKLEETPLYQNLKTNLSEKSRTVYDRLSQISGYDLKNRKTEEEKELLKKQETTLKDIVDKNFKIQIKETKSRSDLIDNFHWIIMRARRLKHITQEQLAKEISEPETAIKVIEKGSPPEDNTIIKKLENYLGIKILKKEFAEKNKEKPKEIGFDAMTAKNLTISDLQEMKRKKEEKEIFGEKIDEEENIFPNEDDLIFEEES
jgi:ribosome-binding protein aMBF1 (putative translation factor)